MNEVILPKWSSNEHEFVRVHRELLESKYVQNKIRCWIDLYFGVKQRDEAYYNIVYSFAYEVS